MSLCGLRTYRYLVGVVCDENTWMRIQKQLDRLAISRRQWIGSPGSAPGRTLGNEYEKTLLSFLVDRCHVNCTMKHQSDTLTYLGRTLMPQLSLITVLGLKRREVRLFFKYCYRLSAGSCRNRIQCCCFFMM